MSTELVGLQCRCRIARLVLLAVSLLTTSAQLGNKSIGHVRTRIGSTSVVVQLGNSIHPCFKSISECKVFIIDNGNRPVIDSSVTSNLEDSSSEWNIDRCYSSMQACLLPCKGTGKVSLLRFAAGDEAVAAAGRLGIETSNRLGRAPPPASFDLKSEIVRTVAIVLSPPLC